MNAMLAESTSHFGRNVLVKASEPFVEPTPAPVVPFDICQWERDVKLDWGPSEHSDLSRNILQLLDSIRGREGDDDSFSEFDAHFDDNWFPCQGGGDEEETLNGLASPPLANAPSTKVVVEREEKGLSFGGGPQPTAQKNGFGGSKCPPNSLSPECSSWKEGASGAWKPGRRNKPKLVHLCTLCPMKFAREGQLATHQLKHETQKEKTCPICRFPAVRWVGLRRHLSRVHHLTKAELDKMMDGMKPSSCSFPCSKCSTVLKSQKSSQRHTHKHLVEENMERGFKRGFMLCKLCGGEFEGMAGIRKHLFLKHGPEMEVPLVHCSICGKGFHTSTTLDYHVKGEHKNEWHSTCTLCSKGFHTALDLERHTRLVHRSEDCGRFHICPICGQKFSSGSGFQGHMRQFHHKYGLKSTCKASSRVKRTLGGELECSGCSSSFVNRRALYEHMSAVHPDIAKYRCEACEKRYLTATGLSLHVKTVHLKESAKCVYCHVVSNNQFNLNKHLRHFCPNAPQRQAKSSHTSTN